MPHAPHAPGPATRDRVLGCLKGIATGDAIGKQTETLRHQDVIRWYPDGVRGFEGEPNSPIPRYKGNAKRVWRIGETTDDTERTIAVARAILRDGGIDHTSIGRELLKCSKSVHPGVRSLWEFHQAGNPSRIARCHDGCGAAIRVAPVGILFPSDQLDKIVEGAHETSIPTHGGSVAIAAAAATAAAVSAAIDGATAIEVMDFAERAAIETERRRPRSMNRVFSGALRAVHDDLRAWSTLRPEQVADRYFPDRPLTIVPLALALGSVMQSAEAAIVLAANIGGDADSVASIAGAILGARYPDTVCDGWYSIVETVNGHDLEALAENLAELRTANRLDV